MKTQEEIIAIIDRGIDDAVEKGNQIKDDVNMSKLCDLAKYTGAAIALRELKKAILED